MTLHTHGLAIEARWQGAQPATRWDPPEPGDLYVDSVTIEDLDEARDLLDRLQVLHHAPPGDPLPNCGPQSRIYDWAHDNEYVRENAPTW